MMETLLKKYPKKVDQQKRREYKLEFGQEAYIKKEPKMPLAIQRMPRDSKIEK